MRLTIRTMLFGVVFTLILIACGQGAFSLYTLQKVNAGLLEFSDVRLPRANELGRMRDQFANFRLAEATMLVALDDSTKRLAEQQIDAAAAGIDTQLKALAMLGSAEEEKELADFEAIFKRYTGRHKALRMLTGSGNYDLATTMYVTELGAIYAEGAAALSTIADQGQILTNEATVASAEHYDTARASVMGATGGALLFGIVAVFYIVRSISGPLLRMAQAMKMISRGSFGIEVPTVKHPYELSQMAHTLRIFQDNLQEAEVMREQQAASEKETAELVKAERLRLAEDFGSVMDSFAREFVELADRVAAAAKELNDTAEGTSMKSEAVSHSAEQASSNVRSIATAAEALAASVMDINKQAAYSSELTASAAERAKQTEAAMTHLSDQAGKIEEVIGLISAIAAQTNLLALNATIEAARAGQAGRGFAIVASEVKGLASQTSQATEEISARIREIQDATKGAVEGIYVIVSEVDSVREVSQSIAASVQQQGVATGEIAASAADAASGTGQVTGNITEVSLAATKTGSAAQMLLSLASTLQTRSSRVTEEVERVVSKMKAA